MELISNFKLWFIVLTKVQSTKRFLGFYFIKSFIYVFIFVELDYFNTFHKSTFQSLKSS